MGWLMLLWESSQDDVSCKWLLTGMATALVGTNVFWAMWFKAAISAKDKELAEERSGRLEDLRESFKTFRDEHNPK